MKPQTKLRAQIDKANKDAAKAPARATGGDGRMQAEVLNTSAIMRNLAMDRFKLANPGTVRKTVPLAQLMRK